MLLMDNALVWLLVNVTVFTALAVPVAWLPKANVVGLTATAVLDPIPVNLNVCSVPPGLMVNTPPRVPAATGLKVTFTVQDAPAVSDAQLLVC